MRAADPPPSEVPARVAHHLETGIALFARFQFTAALAECAAAAIVLPAERADDHPDLAWRLAYLHASVLDELGRFDEAAEFADRAAAIAGRHRLTEPWARSVSKRIVIARQQGDAPGVAARLRLLGERLAPDSRQLCAALGSTLSWLGRPETALYYARRCLRLPTREPHRARDRRDLARVLVRLGHLDEARHHLDIVAAILAEAGSSLADRHMLNYVEYQFALATGDDLAAERIASEAAAEVADPANLRYHNSLLGVARAQRAGGRFEAMADTIARTDWHRLGAEHRALAMRIVATAAERRGDWKAAADALAGAHELLAARYLAMPTVLLIEAELSVADPLVAELGPGSRARQVAEFNRALSSRDQLMMAAAKDLRGPIAVFDMAAELLRHDDVDSARIGTLVARGLAEMQLMVDQLRDGALLDERAEPADTDGPAPADVRRSLASAVERAVRDVGPVARARGIEIHVAPAAPAWEPAGDPSLGRAVATLVALAVRAAQPGSALELTLQLDAPRPNLTVELSCEARTANAVDALTAPTAGGPTSWGLVTELLAASGTELRAAWSSAGRIRIALRTGKPSSSRAAR